MAERNDKLVNALVGDFARVTHTHVGGSLTFALNDATDVQITAAAAGDYLRNDGVGQWVDVAVGQLLTDLLTVDGDTSGLDADLLDGQHGSYYQATDPTLVALAAFNTNGLLTQTAADTFAGRSLVQPAAGLTISNSDGVAGNPTFALADDLSALEGLASTGIAVRSASNTWVQRSIAAGTAIGVTNGDGVSGNPTVAVTDAELVALAGLTSAANQLPYFTGSGTAALTTLSTFIRTLLDDADAATARTTLEVAVGTNVQAYDAFLTSIAALGTAADRMIYTTGVDTAAETTLTTFARSILDDADEATFKATVNLEIGVDVQAYDADLAAIAGLAATAGILSRTGAGAFTARTLTAPAAGFTITNDTGAAGNPTFVLANDLGALEGLSSTGIAVRSAADTWVQRSIAEGTGITVTNGDGVSGNPTIAINLDSCRVKRTSSQTIGTGLGSWTYISFDVEDFDTNTMHDNSTNPTRITIKKTGKYAISAAVQFDYNGTGSRYLSIVQGGTTTLAITSNTPATAGYLNLFTIVEISVNSYIEMGVLQDSGGDLAVLASNAYTPRFSIHQLS